MPYSLEIDPRLHRVTFEVRGPFPQAEMFRMIRDMVDNPDFREGYDALVDLTAVQDIPLSGADIHEKVALDKALLPRIGTARWALVATRDVVFGLARMFQILMDDAPIEVGTFRDLGEAGAWLDER